MNRLSAIRFSSLRALLLAGVIALPTGAGLALQQPPLAEPTETQLLARRGGSRGGGRSAGSRGGGGRSRSRSAPARSGFKGSSGNLNRGARRPSGGWSQKAARPSARPSIDRSGPRREIGAGGSLADRPGRGSRNPSRTINRDRGVDRDRNRSINRDVNRDFKPHFLSGCLGSENILLT